MPTQIPSVTGLPGISGPPDWLNPPPPLAGNYQLDDFRWFGATHRTYGGGASRSATFRAICDRSGAQTYLYLSFQANFVPALGDNNDFVYLGLQHVSGTTAMVIRLQVHGPLPVTRAGAPLVQPDDISHPPVQVQSVQISTRANTAANWTVQSPPMPPAWIANNTRVWIQSDTDFVGPPPLGDPHNRWAVQVRVPLSNSSNILDAAGPNLGSAFHLWYLIAGSMLDQSPVILGDNNSTATTQLELDDGNYPLPPDWNSPPTGWDSFATGGGPGTTGGVSIFGNGWNDIVVSNALGVGTLIQNGLANSFIARPRNYSGSTIPALQIEGTFRMANWGSVANDPHQVNFASGSWDYVPGNSPLAPVLSNAAIPALVAGSNPPATDPIRHDVAALNLGVGQSLHQCILVTITGTSLNILTESAYRNMDFDSASLIEREAEINLENLKPFSPAERNIRLAIERINMPAQTPPGYDEKQYLAATLDSLIKAGGPLAKKLGKVRSLLDRGGDQGSAKRLALLIKLLADVLGHARSRQARAAEPRLKAVLVAVEASLTACKDRGPMTDALSFALERFSEWLLAAPAERDAKLAAAVTALGAWLNLARLDSGARKRILELSRALQAWIPLLTYGGSLVPALQAVEKYLAASRPTDAMLSSWRKLGDALNLKNGPVQSGLVSWLVGAARWIKGRERLDALLAAFSATGVTDAEIERIFPSMRVHVYYDTGERVRRPGGLRLAVWRSQPSFGIAAYHEGPLTGWQVAIDGAERIGPNLYQMKVPNLGRRKIRVRLLARGKEEKPLKEEPIVRPYPVK